MTLRASVLQSPSDWDGSVARPAKTAGWRHFEGVGGGGGGHLQAAIEMGFPERLGGEG